VPALSALGLSMQPFEIEVPIYDTPTGPDDVEATFESFVKIAAEHRGRAEAEGFSPEAAEQMAVSLHSGLVALYFTAGQTEDS